MKIHELLEYKIEHFVDFSYNCHFLAEDGNYIVKQSTNFKKGLKKYSNNKKVMSSFKEIINLLKNDTVPKDLPQKFNPHIIKKSQNNMWKDFWDVHLLGSSIIMIFKVDSTNKIIYLSHIGSHDDAKLS